VSEALGSDCAEAAYESKRAVLQLQGVSRGVLVSRTRQGRMPTTSPHLTLHVTPKEYILLHVTFLWRFM
jgi:hypothetical protein